MDFFGLALTFEYSSNRHFQFVTVDDVRILRDIEQFYSTQIVSLSLVSYWPSLTNCLQDEMPVNAAELI